MIIRLWRSIHYWIFLGKIRYLWMLIMKRYASSRILMMLCTRNYSSE